LARAAATPRWDPKNLRKHHQERLRKDPGCFEDLLEFPAGWTMDESDYDLRSLDAFMKAVLIFEGEGLDRRTGDFKEARAYYVDDQLVVVITDSFQREFITCFHEHFDYPHGVVPGPASMPGDRLLRYKAMLEKDELNQFIRRVKPIRGF
jgi:hypothetical protein